MTDQAFDYVDRLLRALRDDPERRALLRGIVVDETLRELTDSLRRLTEAQARTEQRLEALAGRVDDLAAAQARTEERLAALTQTVDQLTTTVSNLVEQVSGLAGHVEWLRGEAVERRYRERPHAYLSRIARRMHLLTPRELDELLESSVERGFLTIDEADKVRAADGVFHGRRITDGTDAYVGLESSVGVGLGDVHRARERAELLARTGVPVEAVVAGTWIVPEAAGLAQASGVWQVTDGRALPPAS